MRIVLRQNVEPDMLLGNALNRRGKRGKAIDVLSIGENGGSQCPGLRSRVTVMGLVEQIADRLVPEHPLIHAPGYGKAMLLESRDSGLHQGDGAVTEVSRHRAYLPNRCTCHASYCGWTEGAIARYLLLCA